MELRLLKKKKRENRSKIASLVRLATTTVRSSSLDAHRRTYAVPNVLQKEEENYLRDIILRVSNKNVNMNCSGRKRTHSFSNCSSVNASANNAAKKKRKGIYKRSTFVPPTKFLLGGNIRDPLNLSGLQEEDEVRSLESECSDVTVPNVDEFLLGGDINDPLNLKSIVEPEVVQSAATVEAQADVKADVECSKPAEEEGEVKTENCVNGAKLHYLHLNVDPRTRKFDRKDKIVSPVIPQPYRPLKTVPFRQIITPDPGTKVQKTPKFTEKNTRFQYGNYNRYYGYRNVNNGIDLRLEIFEKHRELFHNKDILDIGCNVGHISLIVARSFGARSVTGIDIDRYLIDVAKRNVQYYVNCPSPHSMESPNTMESSNKKLDLKYKCYPVSMPILYGPIYDNQLKNDTCRAFPKNVRFVHGNYVLESEALLQSEQPQYDTILCLSVTKWIHLNWGDAGLKLAFKRMYAQLKPGGILVLEPQSWDSYKRKKSLTETIWRNYQNITLFPHHFDRYLLSSEVGFSRCQTLAVANHQHKGFRRAIKVFRKPTVNVQSSVSPNQKA